MFIIKEIHFEIKYIFGRNESNVITVRREDAEISGQP